MPLFLLSLVIIDGERAGGHGFLSLYAAYTRIRRQQDEAWTMSWLPRIPYGGTGWQFPAKASISPAPTHHTCTFTI